MKLAVIAFTAMGSRLCEKLTKQLNDNGHDCLGYVLPKFLETDWNATPLTGTLSGWTKEQFQYREGIIFVGAAGIAVRSIAPWLKSKAEDPAVVVLDELGRFAVSLLSGHLGGANDLALCVAGLMGAVPVITTATDLEGKFAVDVFARDRGLTISDLTIAKEISADLLQGDSVGFLSDFQVWGTLPEGLMEGGNYRHNIWITVYEEPEADLNRNLLRLIPKLVTLGIGCKKDTPEAVIETQVQQALRQFGIAEESIGAVASIDLKKEEPGLLKFAKKRGLSFIVFSAEELLQAEGDFSESDFVAQTTGVGNVCERAALMAIQGEGRQGKLIMKKQAEHGVTVAAAMELWKVRI